MSDFDWGVVWNALPFLGEGLLLSFLIVAVATAGGLVLGGVLAAMRGSRFLVLRAPATAYVALMRSLPLILVLFWFYFLAPLAIGHPIGSLDAALIAFVLFEAAFYCEIIRAGLAAVRPGQRQAALATGMRPLQALRIVVLPQAIRAMVPILLNQIILVFQDTSLVYVVTLRDFMTSASIVAARDGRPIEMYVFAALVYFALCFVASKLVALTRPAAA